MAESTNDTAPLKRVTVTTSAYTEPKPVVVVDGMMLHPPYEDWDPSRVTFEPPKELKVDNVKGLFSCPAIYEYPPTSTRKGGKARLRFGYPYTDESICYSKFGIVDQVKDLTDEQLAKQAAGLEVEREKTGKKIMRITLPVGVPECDKLRSIKNDLYILAMKHLKAYGMADGGKRVLQGKYLPTLEHEGPVGPNNYYDSLMYPLFYQLMDVANPDPTGPPLKRANLDLPCSIGASVMLPDDGKPGPDGKAKKSMGPGTKFILDDATPIDIKDLENRGFYHSPEIGVSIFIGAKTKLKFTVISSIVTAYMEEGAVGRLQALEGRKKQGLSTSEIMKNRAALHAKSAVDVLTDETDKTAEPQQPDSASVEAEMRAKIEEEIRAKMEAEQKAKEEPPVVVPSALSRRAPPSAPRSTEATKRSRRKIVIEKSESSDEDEEQ